MLDVRRLFQRVRPTTSYALGRLMQVFDLTAPGQLGRAEHDATATALLWNELARLVERSASLTEKDVLMQRFSEWATPPASGPAL